MGGLCLVEELAQEEYVTDALLWFECTPVKTGQVWQFGYFFLWIQYIWPIGHTCLSLLWFFVFILEQINLFQKYKYVNTIFDRLFNINVF